MLERILSILLDGIAVNLAMLFSFLFRFLGQVPPDYWATFWALAVPYTLLCWLAFWAVGLYRRSPRITSTAEIWLILADTIVVCLLFGLFTIVVPLAAPYPRSIILFAAFIIPSFAGGWRLALRALEDRRRPTQAFSSSCKSALIVGAGEAGRQLAQLIKNDPQSDLRLLGFIDDDPRKASGSYEGLPVLGSTEELPELMRQRNVEEILLAIPSANVADHRRLLDDSLRSGAHIQTLGSLREDLEGGLKLSHLREARLEDLISSGEISLDHDAISSYISGQRVLITGAGGGAGGAIALQLAEYNPQLLILLGHGENSIHRIDQELCLRFPQLKRQIVIGDIRDLAKMEDIFNEYLPSVVFHAAAYKQVAYMEYFPDEAVKTNVIGTKNMALLADAYGVRRFIFLSTERADRPSSVTGATKRVAEEILQNAAVKSKTIFLTVRFGNLLGSRGGLLETVDQQLFHGDTVSITHPEMRRKYLMAGEAVQLLLQAGAISKGNEIIVLGIGCAFKVQDLVERYLQLRGKKLGKPVRFIYPGPRPGERLEDGEGTPQELEPTGWPGLLRMKPSSPLGMDFPVLLAQLEKEATYGTAEKVVAILQRIVPTYEPQRDFALPRLVKSQQKSRRRSLGEIGIELGFLNEESLQRAISRQQVMEGVGRKRLGEILLEEGDLAEVELRKILQRQEAEKPIEATGILGTTPTFTSVLPIVSPTLPALSDIGKDFSQIVAEGILTKGKYVDTFEKEAAEYLGVKYAVATSSCTLGLMLVCYALSLRGEVIVPSFTFSATVHALAWNRLTPVFADCLPGELSLDPLQVEKLITDRTAAIMAVHIFGNPAKIEALEAIAHHHGLPLIFDAAHGFGTLYRGKPVGSYGNAEVFSSSPTKLLVTGEGGVVTTNDTDLAYRLRVLREYGNPGNYDSIYPGLNARMAEINALLGIKGLPQLEANAVRRNELVAFYKELLSQVPGISFQTINPLGRSSYKDFTILVDKDSFGLSRNQLCIALGKENIQTKKYYSLPLHLQKTYSQYRDQYIGLLPVTEQVSSQSLSLPIYSHMEEKTIRQVCQVITSLHERAEEIRPLLVESEETSH